ncbi:hypothetical protein HPB50_000845 [Hyalomma asiaticum]|uniref:Uncharacterized protein n=1 Tax=Hyalomma asiaticum TaxID=266040 RepID=A0ACB7S0N1_HYAAI|nr:hypothetical protein HPB50_000845 [Hyalomma asiaticum]
MPLPGCRNLVVVLLAMLLLFLVAASPKARAASVAASSRGVDASAEDADDNTSSDSSQETTVRRLRHGRARAAAAIAASADADELGEGSSSSEEQDSGGGGMVADDPNDAANEAVKHPRGTSRYLQLYCRTGYNLVIHANGKVNGTREDRNRYGQCTDVLSSSTSPEDVRASHVASIPRGVGLPSTGAHGRSIGSRTVSCDGVEAVVVTCAILLDTADRRSSSLPLCFPHVYFPSLPTSGVDI